VSGEVGLTVEAPAELKRGAIIGQENVTNSGNLSSGPMLTSWVTST